MNTTAVTANLETNVRVPPCALGALDAVAASRGVSRDEAVRRLLIEHVERQEEVAGDDRLTHISTVLRYPWPLETKLRIDSACRLRLRLPAGVSERAVAVSLRLPGQSRRAHRDYQGRMLTDAVVTAVARVMPFSDEFLGELVPLLRHRSALGLWQLAAAVTSTEPERRLHDEAVRARGRSGSKLSQEQLISDRRVMLAAEALDEEVCWHAHTRFDATAGIARTLLAGSRALANEQILYDQGAAWDRMREQLRRDAELRNRFGGLNPQDWAGRGGAAVWRAERKVELQDFEDWLTGRATRESAEREIRPPGWRIRLPGPWRGVVEGASGGPTPPYQRWADEERVVAFPYLGRRAIWPLTTDGRPVAQFKPIVGFSRKCKPDRVVHLIEAVLIDWSQIPTDADLQLRLPAEKALAFGLIGADELRSAKSRADETNRALVNEIMDIRIIGRIGRAERARLNAVRENVTEFARLARRLDVFFKPVKPSIEWSGGSVAAEALVDDRPEYLEWLAYWSFRSAGRALERSMELARRVAAGEGVTPTEYY